MGLQVLSATVGAFVVSSCRNLMKFNAIRCRRSKLNRTKVSYPGFIRMTEGKFRIGSGEVAYMFRVPS